MEVTPSKPAVTYVKKNDIILPDAKKALQGVGNTTIAKAAVMNAQTVEVYNFDKVRSDINQSGKNIVNAIKSQSKPKPKRLDLGRWWVGSNLNSEEFIRKFFK